jgi:TonB family protein
MTLHDSRGFARLACFTAASVALHALTLGVYAPGGGAAAASRLGPAVLHAVLAPRDAASDPSPDVRTAEREGDTGARQNGVPDPAPAEPHPTVAKAAPRPGPPGALDIPLPEQWYSASELDVRAEPRNSPALQYPQELAASGLSAKVRIVLFIDERGVVRKTQLAESGPERPFDVAAAKAWDNVRFSPAMKNGVPVKSQKMLELDFTPDLMPQR